MIIEPTTYVAGSGLISEYSVIAAATEKMAEPLGLPFERNEELRDSQSAAEPRPCRV
jgi:hypothetical protein